MREGGGGEVRRLEMGCAKFYGNVWVEIAGWGGCCKEFVNTICNISDRINKELEILKNIHPCHP